MDDLDKLLEEQTRDPEFKTDWDAIQPELAIAQAVIDARAKAHMTQQTLSELTGIAQGDISKLERGSANPSLRTLQRLAAGLGKQLKVEFVPATLN